MPTRKRYTTEFKREAVKLAQTTDKSHAIIAQELGISYKTLTTWLRNAMTDSSKPTSKKAQHHYKELVDENARLKRDLKRAQMERDILKKAAAYFAKESTSSTLSSRKMLQNAL